MFLHKEQSYVIKMLRKQIADLEDENESVKRYTEDFYGHKTDEALQNWLEKTKNFIQTAHDLVDVGKHGTSKCPFGLCLNPKSSYQLRKKAEQICQEIAAQVQKAREFSNIPPSYRQEKVAADRFEDFESRSGVLKDIMEALRSPCIYKIGVYGKPGMGKTMMVREVKRRAELERLFDAVVMATVGKNPDLPRIQGEIARVSNELTSLEASTSKQAGLIEKKVLMILDDIWEPGLSLELLGINKMEEDIVMSYKILLTSRDKNVASLLSETQFEIGKLAWKEARNLFEKIADDPNKIRGFPYYVDEIAKKCEELPIAVATLANALRRRNLIEWKTILRKLQSPLPDQPNSSQIPQSLHSAIELHYSGLKSNELQQTFLLCSLLGPNATIQNLLKYGLGLGLFPGVESIEEARAQVLNLVTELRDSSLLLDGGSSLYFDMHDLVRDFATSTASKEHGKLALREDAPINWSNTKAMESIKWIYLSNGDASPLPDEVKCPKLTFFHLSNKGHFLASRPNLFRDKEGLKVLSLSKLNFMSIPTPISLPKNLCTFCLDQVELGEANIGTMMAELENLQVLSLAGSDIKELPEQMGQLAKLKLLDLSDCTKLEVIPAGVLSSLSGLEELYMRNSFDQWAEGIEEHEIQNASLAELKHLKLTAIEVCIICDIQKIPEGLFSENLARFKVFLGDRWNYWDGSWGTSKLLKLKLDARISFEYSVRKLLKKTNELHLQGRIGVENVVTKLDKEGFQELKYLFVQDALEIKNIFSNSMSLEHSFPVLEVLFLRNLKNMEKICNGLLGASSFRKLRLITIECCNKLKNLFSSSMVRQLQQLQEIKVKDCSDMEEIVDDKEQGSGNDAEEPEGHKFVELISLRSLMLQHLPKLINFNSSCKTETLFNEKVVFSNLEELQLSSIMVNNTIWCTSMTSIVEKLTKLIIHDCDNLEYVFSLSTARGLLKLRHLQVKACKRMKMIIVTENEKQKENLIFSQLNFLLIKDLQNFIGFYLGNCIVEFPSLKQLQVLNCVKLEKFIVKSSAGTNVTDDTQSLFNEKVVFSSNLEELQLSSIMVNNTIWDTSMTSYVENLTKLIIHGCDNMKYLFSSSIARGLLKLRHLQVKECKRMRMIIINKIEEEKENLIFSQLNFLLIEDLQNLVGFYSENCIVEFPSLKQLLVLNCLKLEGFIVKSCASTNVTVVSQPLFNEKVVFSSNLEELQLFSIMVKNSICHTSMMSCVEKLRKLIIQGCNNLEYIFSSSVAWDSKGVIQHFLPKLKRLELGDLPALKSICSRKVVMVCDVILIRNCKSLKRIPLYLPLLDNEQPSPPPSLKQIVLWPQEWWESLEWDHPNAKDILLPFVTFYGSEKMQFADIDIDGENTLLIPSIQELVIQRCNNLRSLNDFYAIKDAIELKRFKIWDCKGMECVLSSSINPLVQKLEVLDLYNLENLNALFEAEAITKSPLPPDAFSSLKTISVCQCDKIKKLFPFWMSLQSLEEIEIKECKQMEEIIAWDVEEARGGEEDGVMQLILPKLRRLELVELTTLKRMICSRRAVIVCDSLKVIVIRNCKRLRRIPIYLPLLDNGQPSRLPSLKQIIVWPQEWWELLKWDYPNAKDVFLPFLTFYGSKRMEFIDIDIDGENTLLLPSVQELVIQRCNNLRSLNDFYAIKDAIELKHFKIWDCKGMECVLSSPINPLVQKLEVLDLYKLENLDALFEAEAVTKSPLPPDTFSSLKTISICQCDKIKKLFPFWMYPQSLEEIEIKECKQMEEIIAWDLDEAAEEEKEGVIQLILPKLKCLTLKELPALKNICSRRAVMVCDSLEEIWIRNCMGLRRMPLYFLLLDDGQQSPPASLKQITVWRELSEWYNYNAKDVLRFSTFHASKKLEFINFNFDEKRTWLPPSVQQLVIRRCNNLRSLNNISAIKDVIELKHCHSRDCKAVECVLSSSINSLVQKLEVLDLYKLENLDALFEVEAVTKSPLRPDTFSSLKTVSVCQCDKIKKLFPFWMYLKSLEVIEIKECRRLEEIMAWDAKEAGGDKDEVFQFILPKLKSLMLEELPALKSICRRRVVMVCDSLQEIWIGMCKDLRRIPLYLPHHNGQLSCPRSLERIVVWSEKWWESLEWDHPNAKDVLLQLRAFT